jgi:hypothetical protein
MYLLVQFTGVGDLQFKSITAPEFIPWLKLLFLVAAVIVLLFGAIAGFLLRPTQKN